MKRHLVALFCLAWAGVAITSAAPANAFAITLQQGRYGACSANYELHSDGFCTLGTTNYTQTIKLIGEACTQGSCNNEVDTVYTDFVYDQGRKEAFFSETCGVMNVYELGSCSC